jgi:hypothetical protein
VSLVGALEIALGTGLLIGRRIRVFLAVVGMHLCGTFLVLLLRPDVAFVDGNLLRLSVEGEYVVKNIVLLAAAASLALHSLGNSPGPARAIPSHRLTIPTASTQHEICTSSNGVLVPTFLIATLLISTGARLATRGVGIVLFAIGLSLLLPQRSLKATLHISGVVHHKLGDPTGPAGVGVVLRSESGEALGEIRRSIGVATNTVAEYAALVEGLNMALEKGVDASLPGRPAGEPSLGPAPAALDGRDGRALDRGPRVSRPAHKSGLLQRLQSAGAQGAEDLIDIVDAGAIVLLLACIVASAVSLVQRFRRSHGQERLQIKWLAAAAALVAFAYVTLMVTAALEHLFEGINIPLWVEEVLVSSFLVIPLAIGVAMLKYRLYNIDLIINRTLVYGALPVSLGGVYLLVVVILQQLLRPVAGRSPLAVAGSTLVTAALFGPARSRLQSFIDRRFYREKYDAARTVEEFTARLRDEVDLTDLSDHLGQVVQTTMQPTRMSLWLRNQ